MMVTQLLYNIGITFYDLLLRVVAPFSRRASLLVEGRKGLLKHIETTLESGRERVWFHCASLGEFEQGRPLIEKFRDEFPDYEIVLTFYSPSGYRVRQGWEGADRIFYLPSDRPSCVRRFIKAVNPSLAIFIKYEFWHNYLRTAQNNSIPILLVSGIFRREQVFFRWYGSFFRSMLKRFNHLFVQDKESAKLLAAIGIMNVTVSGDTRFERVAAIVASAPEDDTARRFCEGKRIVVAGSSWRPEEEMIARYIQDSADDIAFIIAPHETGDSNIERLMQLFGDVAVLWSEAANRDITGYRVLIINTIGILSSLYRYGEFAVIGGGFGRGIHNILEAAAWGKPVLIGPNHQRFNEAIELKSKGGACSFSSYPEFAGQVREWITDSTDLQRASCSCLEYVSDRQGATEAVTDYIRALIKL